MFFEKPWETLCFGPQTFETLEENQWLGPLNNLREIKMIGARLLENIGDACVWGYAFANQQENLCFGSRTFEKPEEHRCFEPPTFEDMRKINAWGGVRILQT